MNKLVSLQWWNPEVALTEINFNTVQFWVQLQGLPMEFITVGSAEKILSQIGKLIEIEDPRVEGKLIRPYIRARVEININTPLSTGCWVPRKNLPKIWVFIKYERLQDLCYCCGIIGHDQNNCTKDRVMSVWGKNIHRYSARVGVAPAKTIKMILEEQARRRRNSKGENSQETTSQTEENEQDTVDKTELAVQALQLNKERFDFERAIEVEEGDGSMPTGWSEIQQEDLSPPVTRDAYQNCSRADNEPIFYSNLRFPRQFPVTQVTDIDGGWRKHRFQERREGDGEEDLGGENRGLTGQVGCARYPENIPLNKGLTVTGAGEQVLQGTNQGEKGGLSKKVIRDLQYPIVIRETCDERVSIQDLTSSIYDASIKSSSLDVTEKEKESRKPDWWAQEQIDNAEAFENLQVDLQKLRDEVKAYWEGKEDTGPNASWAGKTYNSYQLFKNKEQGQSSTPILGPYEVERSQLLEASVGLKQPWVHMSHHSPPESPTKYTSIILSKEDIEKCRRKCDPDRLWRRPKRGSEDLIMEDGGKEHQEVMDYFVELPSDEDSINQEVEMEELESVNPCRMGEEEEKALVVKISNSLILKRPRRWERVEGDEGERRDKDKGIKRVRIGWNTSDEDMGTGSSLLQAEEAGQPMPPTSP